MKRLSEILHPVNEILATQDPPTVLVLRRKAIRLFPGNQRVATYRNDNLDLEVAIPYNPETLGKSKITTSVTEESSDPTAERKSLYAHAKQTGSTVMKRMAALNRNFDDHRDLQHHMSEYNRAKADHADAMEALRRHIEKHGKISGVYSEALEETFDGIPLQFKIDTIRAAYKRLVGEEPKSALDNALYNWLQSEMYENGDDISDWDSEVIDDVFDDYQALIGVTDIEEHTYNRDAVNKAIRSSKPKIGSRESKLIHRLLRGRHGPDPTTIGPKEHAVSKPMKALLTGEEAEPIQESTIHSLHSIARSKTPAMVRFRNGSSAMVHHGTAARIMKLHSLMRKHNKRKIEALVNSSPDGLKKVVDFADVHLK
jgi:hypothetical protein